MEEQNIVVPSAPVAPAEPKLTMPKSASQERVTVVKPVVQAPKAKAECTKDTRGENPCALENCEDCN